MMKSSERFEKMRDVVRREQEAQAERELEARIASEMLASQEGLEAPEKGPLTRHDRLQALVKAEWV